MTKASLGKAWASSPASLPGSPLEAFASPFPSNVLYCLSPRCVCLTYSSISPACLRVPQTMSTQCSVPRPSSELKHPPYPPLPHCSSHRPMVIRKRLDCLVNHNVKVETDNVSATKAALEQLLKVNKNTWNQTPLRLDSKGGFMNTALPSYTQIRSEWVEGCGRDQWDHVTIPRTNEAHTGAESSPGKWHSTWGQGPGLQGWSEARKKEQCVLSSFPHTSNFYKEGNTWRVLIIIFLGGWQKRE